MKLLTRLKKKKLGLAAMGFILFVCFLAVFAEDLAYYPFDEQDIDHMLEPPSAVHWAGTDSLGRDLLSRMLFGARMSLVVGVLSTLIALVFGCVYGLISGWFGGAIDAWMMRAVDVLYSIPSLVLLIVVKLIFDSYHLFSHPALRSLMGCLMSLSLIGW